MPTVRRVPSAKEKITLTETAHILGIESSCDETAAAVVRSDGRVLSSVVASQIADHAPFGGIVPEVASRAHLQCITQVIERAVEEAGGFSKITAIAVTQGPGLVGSLLVGLQVAKAIAYCRKLPLVGVNHLDGHLMSIYLRGDDDAPAGPKPPFVALLVSGGHTSLYKVDDRYDLEVLGQTRDDAAGEAFDKVAKLLGLGYPGGPVIDRLAAKGDASAVEFPFPMLHRDGYDFSFSGLKTAVALHVKQHGVPEAEEGLADLCASFQRSVVEVLARKAVNACVDLGVGALVLVGGVAANRGLRARAAELCEEKGISLVVPPLKFCTDNAAMIAYAGLLRVQAGHEDGTDLNAYSRDPARQRGRFSPDGRLLSRAKPAGAGSS